MRRFAALVLVLVASLWSVQSFAFNAAALQGLGAVVEDGAATIGFASTGVPLVTAADNTLSAGGGWVQAGNFGIASGATAADGLVMGANGTVQLAGNALPIHAAMNIPVSSLIAGLGVVGAFAGGWPGLLLGATPFLLQWLQSAGGRVDPVTGALERSDPTVCTVAPCTGYAGSGGVVFSTGTSACASLFGAYQTAALSSGYTSVVNNGFVNTGVPRCSAKLYTGAGTLAVADATYFILSPVSISPQPAVWLPSSMDDIAPYMQAVPVNPGVVGELTKAGVDVAAGPMTVTGPSSVSGPQTTTTAQDGTKTTSQKSTPYSYTGPTVTVGPVTTTTTVTNVDNTTNTTTTTVTPAPDTPQDTTPVDTPLPGVPTLYTPKYPGGLVGVWNTREAQMQSTPLMQLSSQLMPSIPAGGSCPSFTIPLNFASWANFGTQDFSPPCSVWTFCQAIVLISALFLCRALIFGG